MSEDVKIKCQDCGTTFVFSHAEQKFYEEKGFAPPKRCKYCRLQRKGRYDKKERRVF